MMTFMPAAPSSQRPLKRPSGTQIEAYYSKVVVKAEHEVNASVRRNGKAGAVAKRKYLIMKAAQILPCFVVLSCANPVRAEVPLLYRCLDHRFESPQSFPAAVVDKPGRSFGNHEVRRDQMGPRRQIVKRLNRPGMILVIAGEKRYPGAAIDEASRH
jgi:hypothetical protein